MKTEWVLGSLSVWTLYLLGLKNLIFGEPKDEPKVVTVAKKKVYNYGMDNKSLANDKGCVW